MSETAVVLAGATVRAGQALGLTPNRTAALIGYDQADVAQGLDPLSNPGKRALMLIRVFQSLDALLGGNQEMILTWMNSHNDYFSAAPVDLIDQDQGFGRVLSYLENIQNH